MTAPRPTLLGFGATGRVELVEIKGGFAARKVLNNEYNFVCERDILQTLQHKPHKNIIGLLGVGRMVLDLEYVEGRTIFELIRDRERYFKVTSDDVKHILVGCLEGLAHFHSVTQMAHFDIKPDNILLTKTLQPKLCDFGHSKHPRGVRYPQGTYEYMPPELHNGMESNFSADTYSLGVTISQLVLRRHPLVTDKEMHGSEAQRRAVLKTATQRKVSLDHTAIPIASALIQAMKSMCEPLLSIRPDPLRVLEFLRTEQLETKIYNLEQSNEALKSQHNPPTPIPQPVAHSTAVTEQPVWMKEQWKLEPEDTSVLYAMVGRLQLPHLVHSFMEFAQYLRKLYLHIAAPQPQKMQAVLDELDKVRGFLGNGTAVELLLLCCLAITHSRKGAINLITNFSHHGKSLRQEASLKEHLKRMKANLLIPVRFQVIDEFSAPPAQQSVEEGELLDSPPVQIASTHPSQADTVPVANTTPDLSSAVREFAHFHELHDILDAAIQCAGFLQHPNCTTPTYFNTMIENEGQTNIGPITSLLLIACIALGKDVRAAARLISSYTHHGQPLRNLESLRKAYQRMKANGSIPHALL